MRAALLVFALAAIGFSVLPGCTKEDAATVSVDAPASPTTTAAVEPSIDPATGFKMTGDWQLVRGHCTGCHSSKLITQQRGTPQQWLTMIRWMQAKQNLWQFDPDTESRIIAYLAENYPPDESQRRAALPADLTPPNPYATASN
jgi:hypothetical protein